MFRPWSAGWWTLSSNTCREIPYTQLWKKHEMPFLRGSNGKISRPESWFRYDRDSRRAFGPSDDAVALEGLNTACAVSVLATTNLSLIGLVESRLTRISEGRVRPCPPYELGLPKYFNSQLNLARRPDRIEMS